MHCPKYKSSRGKIAGKVLFFILVPFLVLGLFQKDGYAGLAISPALLEVNLAKGRPAGQFLISNVGDDEERYRIRAVYFNVSSTGNVIRLEPDKHSLTTWIKFNPTEFILAPKSQQTVRYVITPPEKLTEGEYWGAMELESLKNLKGTASDAKGRQIEIEVIPSIMVPIFGSVGNIRYQGSIKDAQVILKEDRKMIVVRVENTGEGRLKIEGTFELRNSSDEAIEKGSLPQSYIFPGNTRLFTKALKTDLKEGKYNVRVEFHSPHLKNPIIDDFPIVWKPPL